MEALQMESLMGSPLAGSLITSHECVYPATTTSYVADRFFHAAQLDAVALVEGREPVGLVMRPKLLYTLFRRYGFELYGKKPIITIADTEPLILHEDERLDVALDKALERPVEDIYDDIIVVNDDGLYVGLLSVKQMIIQQSNSLANNIVQKEMAKERAKEFEKINQIKSQFIANVTHDLRSPLNAILLVAELIKMSCDNGYKEQVRDRVSILISSANNLKAIVNNVLDLSKIEAGKMEVICESFDLVQIIHEIAETAKVLIGRKQVDIDVIANDGPIFMNSDSVKIRQILTNLMSNAVKFTEKGKVVFEMSIKNNMVMVSVRDTGIGIREEDLSRLFIAFNQLEDGKSKRYEGTGLGLTIAQNLLNLLGGAISIASKYGEGTTFTVHLPSVYKGVYTNSNNKE
ncbi:MAG: HAMP domain-containing sensor histidine kinase [Nitrospirota bacterium]